jgi:hypothetical protein
MNKESAAMSAPVAKRVIPTAIGLAVIGTALATPAPAAEFNFTVPVNVAVRPEARALQVVCEIVTNVSGGTGTPFAMGSGQRDLTNGRFEGPVTVAVSTPIATNPELRMTGYRCRLLIRYQQPDGQLSDWLPPDQYETRTTDYLTNVTAATEGQLPERPRTPTR